MLFVSKHARFVHGIRNEESEIIRLASGREQLSIIVPPLNAEFINQGNLSYAEREEAFRLFGDPREGAFGAIPSMQTGLMGGIAYDAYEPQFALSKFDTDTDIDYVQARAHTAEARREIKELFESRLMTSPENGIGMVRIQARKMEKPWPAYDETPAERVARTAQTMGFDLDLVLAYEAENQNREAVVKGITALKSRKAVEAEVEQAEEDALKVTIPR